MSVHNSVEQLDEECVGCIAEETDRKARGRRSRELLVELARLIGARRTTVSDAASQLRRRKLIAYSRGVIRIVDRAGLEAAACDCYGMLNPRLQGLYGDLTPPRDVA